MEIPRRTLWRKPAVLRGGFADCGLWDAVAAATPPVPRATVTVTGGPVRWLLDVGILRNAAVLTRNGHNHFIYRWSP